MGFPPGFPHSPPDKRIFPGTGAGIVAGVISLIIASFTGIYFLVHCLCRREQRKQINAMHEISNPQEYPEIPPKANKILGQDLKTGKVAAFRSLEGKGAGNDRRGYADG